MTPLMILIETRINELKIEVKEAKELKMSLSRVRSLQGMLHHNTQLLNLLQRKYYEEAEAVSTEKEYLN